MWPNYPKDCNMLFTAHTRTLTQMATDGFTPACRRHNYYKMTKKI